MEDMVIVYRILIIIGMDPIPMFLEVLIMDIVVVPSPGKSSL